MKDLIQLQKAAILEPIPLITRIWIEAPNRKPLYKVFLLCKFVMYVQYQKIHLILASTYVLFLRNLKTKFTDP